LLVHVVCSLFTDTTPTKNYTPSLHDALPIYKVLAAGIVDGRNVWCANLEEKLTTLETIKQFVNEEQLIVQPSSSLLHVPVTKTLEKKIDPVILGGLSFADEKLFEIVRSEEHTSELQSRFDLVCRLLL